MLPVVHAKKVHKRKRLQKRKERKDIKRRNVGKRRRRRRRGGERVKEGEANKAQYVEFIRIDNELNVVLNCPEYEYDTV